MNLGRTGFNLFNFILTKNNVSNITFCLVNSIIGIFKNELSFGQIFGKNIIALVNCTLKLKIFPYIFMLQTASRRFFLKRNCTNRYITICSQRFIYKVTEAVQCNCNTCETNYNCQKINKAMPASAGTIICRSYTSFLLHPYLPYQAQVHPSQGIHAAYEYL